MYLVGVVFSFAIDSPWTKADISAGVAWTTPVAHKATRRNIIGKASRTAWLSAKSRASTAVLASAETEIISALYKLALAQTAIAIMTVKIKNFFMHHPFDIVFLYLYCYLRQRATKKHAKSCEDSCFFTGELIKEVTLWNIMPIMFLPKLFAANCRAIRFMKMIARWRFTIFIQRPKSTRWSFAKRC